MSNENDVIRLRSTFPDGRARAGLAWPVPRPSAIPHAPSAAQGV